MTSTFQLHALPLVLAALTSCSDVPEATTDANEVPVTSLRQITGPWDIVRFGEHRPTRLGTEGLRHAYLNVAGDRLSYTIECNHSGNPARIDEKGVLHDTGDGSRMQTLMGCGAEQEARDKAFFRFFGSRPSVGFIKGGQLRMASGRTELILERPEVRRLANTPSRKELEGRWLPSMAFRTFDGAGHEGWAFQSPSVLTVAGDRVYYSGCAGAEFTFRLSKDARLQTEARQPQPSCGEDRPATRLLEALGAQPFVERTASNGIALSAGSIVIHLQNEEEVRRARDNPPPPPPVPSAPPPPPPPPSQSQSMGAAR